MTRGASRERSRGLVIVSTARRLLKRERLGTAIPTIEHIVKAVSNVHRPDGRPNVFVFSHPRSGSTWLMELIWSQPGFKHCNEPLNVDNPYVGRYSKIDDWRFLYSRDSLPVIHEYFTGFCDGRLQFKNPNPISRYYRPVTRRIVFKEIHGGLDRINWFAESFNGRPVYLVRHPIAVSVSKRTVRHLRDLLASDYARHFASGQLNYARDIAESGTKLEQDVVLWCLHNAVPLKQATPEWSLVSYEQLVLDPDPVIDYLAARLDLPRPDRMRMRLLTPSGVRRKSNLETQTFLRRGEARERGWLVEKWRERIDERQERHVMKILDRFELDVYQYGEVLPAPRIWIQRRRADSERMDSRPAGI
jgi:sulfotransferase family protein